VTNKTGFGFDDRINLIFMQLVAAVHKSLSDTLSSSSTGHSRLLTQLHHSTTPLYSVLFFWLCPFITPCTDPTENTVSFWQECVFIGPLLSNGCPSIVKRICFGMRSLSRCLAIGLCVTIFILMYHRHKLLDFILNCNFKNVWAFMN
jgi:hypothetical protein